MTAAQIAARRLPLVPNRVQTNGPRTGAHLEEVARQVGDLWWKCGNEVTKPVYTEIDKRYPYSERAQERVFRAHRDAISDAKKILSEHRNEVCEAVLPLFDVRKREAGESFTLADEHARDYMVKNLFVVFINTLKAWTPNFVALEDVERVQSVIDNVGSVQKERLDNLLLNFTFRFRPVRTGKQR
jgi:hypothetical protein